MWRGACPRWVAEPPQLFSDRDTFAFRFYDCFAGERGQAPRHKSTFVTISPWGSGVKNMRQRFIVADLRFIK